MTVSIDSIATCNPAIRASGTFAVAYFAISAAAIVFLDVSSAAKATFYASPASESDLDNFAFDA